MQIDVLVLSRLLLFDEHTGFKTSVLRNVFFSFKNEFWDVTRAFDLILFVAVIREQVRRNNFTGSKNSTNVSEGWSCGRHARFTWRNRLHLTYIGVTKALHFALLDLDSFTDSTWTVHVAFRLRLLWAIDWVQFFGCGQNQRIFVCFVEFLKTLPWS